MKQTRNILKSNIVKYPEFRDLNTLISEIEDNVLIHPDITIESCKSLIEGVSKQIVKTFDNTRTEKKLDEIDAPRLYKDAITVLDRECEKVEIDKEIKEFLLFEAEFAKSFSGAIHKLCEIRNRRGDICHGRSVPKKVFSDSRFSRMIKSFADTHIAYMLDIYFFLLKNKIVEKLVYEDLEEFNKYLDSECVDFPISKATYSRILYEYEYETYADRYKNEFLDSHISEDSIIRVEQEIIWSPDKVELVRRLCTENDLYFDSVLNVIDGYINLGREISNADIYDSMVLKTMERVSHLRECFSKLLNNLQL